MDKDDNIFEIDEIDLKELMYILIDKIKFILLISLLSAMIFGMYNKFLVTDIYSSNVTMYVNNNKDAVSRNLNAGDINASTMLASTYVHLINSNAILTEIADNINLGYNAVQISEMLNIAAITDTQILQISVRNSNPDHSFIIANAIADIAPVEITKIMDGSSVKVVDYAERPLFPIYPSVSKSVVIGFLVGFVLACLIVFVIYFFDNIIRSESDVNKIAPNIPILGVIPEIINEGELIEEN